MKKISVQEFDESETVYNFQVADFHTYYVTQNSVLVHNANCGGREKMGKIKGNTPGNNIVQNKQFKAVVREFKLNKDQTRELHEYITGQGYSYQELRDVAIRLFPK